MCVAFGIYPTLPLLKLALCLGLPDDLEPSNPYIPPAKNTMNAPTNVPGDSLLPNNQILSKRLTNFLTFNTMVTVSAEAAEARRLTPRIQAYWVNTFMTRYASWLGRWTLSSPFCNFGARFKSLLEVGRPNGVEAASWSNCLFIEGRNGMKSGSASKCE